ncbi:fumarylacetoacetate hydrolase family protein [Magnetovibrio sp. PR-2]|uniref:fumarylacetoacetate hydrolase family protein n=1 Tax=Magnetovibrio sp. PR-2 TaxID=3120356 RepID=UPI002FCE1021
MKLLRFGPKGSEKPGRLDGDGNIRDLSALISDIDGACLSDAALAKLADVKDEGLPLISDDVRIGPCVTGVGKMMAIGLNFSDHAKETGMEPPAAPVLFTKYTSAINGPNDDVVLPRGSQKADWEVELGVVMGKAAKYVSQAEALDCVAGYTVVNDVSERSFQLEGTGQWVKGKSCDTFAPLGPWLVTRDEIADPQDLNMWLDVNGEARQRGNTQTMIFSVAHIISFLSNHFTLHPGDVICTGTPPGVGMGMKPQQFLKDGDVMRLGIDGLGEQNQAVRTDD